MKNSELEQILLDQTQELKNAFVLKMIEWAKKDFNYYMGFNGWSTEKWCEYFKITPEIKNKGMSSEFIGYPSNFYNTEMRSKQRKIATKMYSLHSIGLDRHIEQTERLAVMHYEQSIKKLTHRISQKELNQDNLSVKTATVGQNIETVLTDGVKTVRAFTILAWGEVNQPHYRYLIK